MPASNTDLTGALVAALTPEPDKPFLTGPDDALTRGAFLARVAARQRQLRAGGLGRGARIIVFAGAEQSYWADLVAVWGLGAAAIPTEQATAAALLAQICAIAEPDAAIGAEPASRLDPIVAWLGAPPPSEGPVETVGEAGELAAIAFTSGSTGAPKGVALNGRSFLGNARATLERLDFRPSDRLFISIPFNFFSAICHFLATALAGATLIATGRRLIYAECAADAPLPLRWMMSSGDHLPAEVIRTAQSTLPDTGVVTVYGLTELGGRFCMLGPEMAAAHAGSVGTPIRGLQVSICDDDGTEVAPGEVGEVFATGDYLLSAYHGDPGATARALTANGFRTGDLGYRDEHGLLHLAGRADDVFKCNGQKVSTVPIAEALMATGTFADVAVIAWDDAVLGTVPRVFYVLSEGARFDKGAVLAGLRHVLPELTVPRLFSPVESIPRTGSGKIMRAELRRLAT